MPAAVPPSAAGVADAPAPVPASPAPSSSPATQAVPLAEQLGARLATLGGLHRGTHVLSVPVDPVHLGPVRIVAHIGADSVRVELVGAGEASRQALQAALGDLRRDLAAAGVQVDVGAEGRRGGSGTAPETSSGSPGGAGGSQDGLGERTRRAGDARATPATSSDRQPSQPDATSTRSRHLDLVV
ncbi:MAG: flagellar hook-length control protein FliK [Cellulomonas sp.]|uniref:flagellar hook-length control protein FliK n=1 Tax=Cellulomonas sp. TaxID=40001 RepID=UPI00258FF61C|nr:flagellar hook-length control protein FliK [Cellulomonas sp.]MCR6705581.1 flagellar hook-length control protein FliK [Cellulomonas sp.]